MKFIRPYRLFVGAFLPNWLLRRPEISLGAKCVYARLAQYSGKDGYCNPKIKTLASELGISERNCIRHVQELEKQKLILKHRRGLGRSNEYRFLKHPWMNFDVQKPATS